MQCVLRFVFLFLAAACLLSACGGGGGTTYVPVAVPAPAPAPSPAPEPAPDPLLSYRTQILDWQACPLTLLGPETEDMQRVREQLGGRLRCAVLRAPIDYANPARGDLAIRVLRVAATDAAHRQGALFFNPGGPGQDGLATPVEFFQIFAGSDPAHSQGALQLRLLAEFDLIGFSPRGTGDSTALTCVTPLRERAVDYSPAGLAAQNLESAFFNLATIAEACHRNPLTPFISSDTTARDMDLLRAVLGEQRVNYFGVSYGTWLGAWYASLFPDRVGRMLLDSSWDFGSTMEHNFNQHPKSFHRVLDEVLLPYATRHPEAFGLGTSTASLRTALLGLPDPLLDVLSLPLFELSYYAWDAERHLDHIKAALVLQRLMEPGEPSDEGRVRQGIEDSVFVAGDVQRDQAIREVAHAVFDSYVQRWLAPPPPKSLTQDPMASTYWAVRCNDTPSTRDRAYWVDLLHTLAPDYPLFYSVLLDNPCPFWTTGGVQKPPITPMQKLDILLVQSQFDAPTPKEGADALFAALPAAHRVYVPGEHQHGVYPYLDACVDLHVTRYLLGESPTDRETTCPAQPLYLDWLAQQAVQRGSARAMAAPVKSAYTDPSHALDLIERFKKHHQPHRSPRKP